MEIGNPHLVWLLASVPVLLALSFYNTWARRRAHSSFGSKTGQLSIVGDLVSAIVLAIGIGLLVLACMDIRWGKTTREVPQKGLEVVFALDVSRSMLAEDAKPNRLVRAKQQIKDMVGEMAGDRVGLVAFAGEAFQAVPLTNHYDDFRQKLDEVGPHSVSKGGSQLGVAIQAAADAFLSKTNEHKTVVLITDGEDQESKPLELAKSLHAENGLRIFTIGLGDIDQGSRIPDADTGRKQYVEHDGRQVWSKLNGSILREIATATKAAYVPAGIKRVNMADVYHNYIAAVEKTEFETAKINTYVARFQWFAFPALVCLLLNVWMSTPKAKRNWQAGQTQATPKGSETIVNSRASIAGATKVAAVAFVLTPASLFAQPVLQSPGQDVASKINAANELVRNDESDKAIEAFGQIEVDKGSNYRDELKYNLASAHYRNSDLEAAQSLFEETAKSTNTQIASDSRYNLGNCHYSLALPAVEQQPETAIGELEQAVAHYRSALRLDRQRSDARENIQRARKLIEQLQNQQGKPQQNQDQQQQQNQDQQQNQEQQKNDSSDDQQQKSKGQQQENESQQDQQQQGQQDQSESNSQGNQENRSSESQSQDSEQSQEDQSSPEDQSFQGSQDRGSQDSQNGSEGQQSEDTESESSEQSPSTEDGSNKDQQGNDSQNNQASNTQRQPANDQSKAPDTNQTGPEEPPNAGKEPPKGNITAANESKGSPANQTGSANLGNGSKLDNGMMSKREALKVLQSVRDRDMIRRLGQQQRQRQRRIKVDKDW